MRRSLVLLHLAARRSHYLLPRCSPLVDTSQSLRTRQDIQRLTRVMIICNSLRSPCQLEVCDARPRRMLLCSLRRTMFVADSTLIT